MSHTKEYKNTFAAMFSIWPADELNTREFAVRKLRSMINPAVAKNTRVDGVSKIIPADINNELDVFCHDALYGTGSYGLIFNWAVEHFNLPKLNLDIENARLLKLLAILQPDDSDRMDILMRHLSRLDLTPFVPSENVERVLDEVPYQLIEIALVIAKHGLSDNKDNFKVESKPEFNSVNWLLDNAKTEKRLNEWLTTIRYYINLFK